VRRLCHQIPFHHNIGLVGTISEIKKMSRDRYENSPHSPSSSEE
jgi:hypothetical protein